MYLYETHMHTAPISACARAGVRETLEFYKSRGYTGVFMSDHFLDGNIDFTIRDLPYDERIKKYFSVVEEGKKIGTEIGLDVFSAFEMSYKGTDFLIYGIDMEWCLAHEDMDKMRKSELLRLLMSEGALVIQAHPFREAGYIDHIRLFPREVHGVEVYNACRTDFENKLAEQYRENYGLIAFAGSDNHRGAAQEKFGGMATEKPIKSIQEFIDAVLSGGAKPFMSDENGVKLLNV